MTTQNNQQAEIIQGRQIPVQTVANFTVTTRYVNAALELRATPQITAEGTIIMTIEIQNNAADFANLVNGIPPITTQSARTTVMIPDGGTTVIGGIYRTEDSITRDRVPFLWYRYPSWAISSNPSPGPNRIGSCSSSSLPGSLNKGCNHEQHKKSTA